MYWEVLSNRIVTSRILIQKIPTSRIPTSGVISIRNLLVHYILVRSQHQ